MFFSGFSCQGNVSLSNAVWNTLWGYFPLPSLAAHPHSFQDSLFLHENSSMKGTFNVFFVLVAKKLAIFICRSGCQMLSGRDSAFVLRA